MSHNDALNWIIDFLEAHNIPYLICGGLAAMAYGAHRPLNDIDLYVPLSHFNQVVDFGCNIISYGPGRFKDQHWNVEYVQFNFQGQKIEVGSSEGVAIFDQERGEWVSQSINFDHLANTVILCFL